MWQDCRIPSCGGRGGAHSTNVFIGEAGLGVGWMACRVWVLPDLALGAGLPVLSVAAAASPRLRSQTSTVTPVPGNNVQVQRGFSQLQVLQGFDTAPVERVVCPALPPWLSGSARPRWA